MIKEIKTPAYVLDEKKMLSNLEILHQLELNTGCHVLLAQKAFSIYQMYPKMKKYISGTTASGLYEARLGYEMMELENHVFAPAYKKEEFTELLDICDHIIFNSVVQWQKYKKQALKSGKEFGIRINPEFSTQTGGIYDPCSFGSRLGVLEKDFKDEDLEGISGIHFHTLCEQNADDLEKTVDEVIKKFGTVLKKMKWINLGGGHHITRADYDIKKLENIILRLKKDYDVEVYIEPGEAVVLNAGYMVSEVLDIVDNGVKNAIIDASAACHMPDILEMPYTPKAMAICTQNNSSKILCKEKLGKQDFNHAKIIEMVKHVEKENENIFRFGGNTCLAGDVFGDYIFEKPLNIGDRVVFYDMALYTMVKNNTFNGIPLPSILLLDKEGNITTIKEFDYSDFKTRL